MRKKISGATMKRAESRSSFLFAAILFVAAATAATFAPIAIARPQASAPVSRSETEPSTSQGPQKASGIVPPGVKLAPEMPAPGALRPFEFPTAAPRPCPTACAFSWSPIIANPPSPRAW
jgi:hypothetical protein